jgi:hypothetical protein
MSAIPQQVAANNRTRAHSLGYRAALLALIAIACWIAASTYSVFDHTWDEPEHLAAGLALLDTGAYPYDVQHPPLARIAMAIGPYLAGARSYGNAGPSGEQEGRDILYGPAADGQSHYHQYLTLARVGMLPFLIVLLVSTWLWTRRTFDAPSAVLATALVVATPVIIGHAAVAALDIPMVGTTMLALYLLLRWFDAPSLPRALAFGIAAGIAAGTKLSAIPFIGCVAIVWTVAWLTNLRFAPGHSASRLIGHASAAALAAFIALTLCYGFALAPLSSASPFTVLVGIPRFIASLHALAEHNNDGHLSYFMGELKRTGWWNFYLVALAVKTPLPLLLAGLSGSIWFGLRSYRERRWMLAAPALAIVAIVMFCSAYSHINIGVRHVMIVFPLMAIIGGAFIVTLWQRFQHFAARALLVALLGWQGVSAVNARPDYLAYFNELAGSHPEKILIDSDLDWGQDLKRLKRTLRERKIESFTFIYRGTADLQRHGFPPHKLLWPGESASGWIAVSLLARATGNEHGGYEWLNAHTPVARVGRSIDLYYIKP